MPNATQHDKASKSPAELVQRAMTAPGQDPMAVKVQIGAVTYAVNGFGFSQTKVGADDDAAVSPIAPARPAATPPWMDLGKFSAVRYYLSFETVAGAVITAAPFTNTSTATVEVYAANDNGHVVRVGGEADVGQRTERRVEGIGRPLRFRLTDITLTDVTQVTLHVAGEGTGYGA